MPIPLPTSAPTRPAWVPATFEAFKAMAAAEQVDPFEGAVSAACWLVESGDQALLCVLNDSYAFLNKVAPSVVEKDYFPVPCIGAVDDPSLLASQLLLAAAEIGADRLPVDIMGSDPAHRVAWYKVRLHLTPSVREAFGVDVPHLTALRDAAREQEGSFPDGTCALAASLAGLCCTRIALMRDTTVPADGRVVREHELFIPTNVVTLIDQIGSLAYDEGGEECMLSVLRLAFNVVADV